MVDPTIGLAAGRWSGEKRLEMLDSRLGLPASHVEKGESVVRPGKRGLEAQCLSIALDRLFQPIHACQRDREVLQHLRIIRLGPQGEPVRRNRRVKVPGPLQRQCLVQVVEALRLQLAFGSATEEAAQPGHSLSGDGGAGQANYQGTTYPGAIDRRERTGFRGGVDNARLGCSCRWLAGAGQAG